MASLKTRTKEALRSVKDEKLSLAMQIEIMKRNDQLGYFEEIDMNLNVAGNFIDIAGWNFERGNFNNAKSAIHKAELRLEVAKSLLEEIKKSR